MNDNQQPEEKKIDRPPLMTIAVITAGSQVGSAIIQRLARHPLALFGMGMAVGVYSYKNRKEIIREVQHLGEQGKKVFEKKEETE